MARIAEIIKDIPVVYGQCDVVVDSETSVQEVFHQMVSQGAETVGVRTDESDQPILLNRDQLLRALADDVEGLQEMLNRIQKEVTESADERINLLQQTTAPVVVATAQKFEQALKVMMEGLIILDTRGRIELANPAAREMLGLEKQADLETVGQILDQLGFRALMTFSGQSAGQTNGQFRIKSGSASLLDVRWSVLNSDWGQMLGWVLTIRNITNEVAAEATKSEFIAAISHELRTPLTGIQNSVSNIMAGVTGKINDKTRQYLEMMDNDCHRFADLINDLLDIAKLEAGNMPITQKVMSMGSLVQNVSQEFEETAKSAGITLTCEVETDVCPVYADVKRIRQVLTNLLRNAIQYTPVGGAVTISVHDRGSDIVTEVADTGVGISLELQKQIFTKFYQVARQAGPGSKGSGLGLAICKGIIAVHGGTLWLESQSEHGSRFFFSLPKIDVSRILQRHIDIVIAANQQRHFRMGILLVTFEMSEKSDVPLRQAAGKIIAELLTQSRFFMASDMDIALQTGDNEMVFIINDCGRQTFESVRHKIEMNLLNFVKKHFIGIPIVPMLGMSLWPQDGADKNGLETAARKGLAPLLAG
ncbi:MAG: PAS domain-containing protein [Planctomycetes bacterium]|nr:PAS domain-containing protein [Planctomycetota bacterium]